MNIRLFELRDDEVAAYMRAAANLPAGYSISFDTQILSEANIDSVAGCEGIIINNKSVMSAALVERAHELGVRYIAIRCIGFNHVDVKRAQELGIKVCNTAYPPYGVAEFTVMLILMALRRCKAAIWRQQVNDYSLDGLLGRELRTLTVGVVGTGRIGRTVIDNLSGFGCKILAYDPYPNAELANRDSLEYVDMDTLVANSDVITLHVPLMDSTRGIINADAIAKMREDVTIVNVSRGELIDTDAVIEAIEFEKIGALAMDVFEDEVGIYHENRMHDILANRKMAYLRQFPNVLLTNHIAFYTDIDVNCMVEQGVAAVPAMVEGICATQL